MADLTKDRVRAIVREEVLSRTRPRTPPMVRAIFAPVESVDLIGALVEALPVLEEHACRLADAVRDLLEREAVERLREVAPIADTTGMEGRLAEALRRRVQACRCDGSDPACAADRALLAERAAKAAPDYDGECCALCKCNHGSPIRTLTEEHCICRDDGHRWVSRKVAAPPAATHSGLICICGEARGDLNRRCGNCGAWWPMPSPVAAPPVDDPPLIHRTGAPPFTAMCGADEPNQRTTTIDWFVTCAHCKAAPPAGETSMRYTIEPRRCGDDGCYVHDGEGCSRGHMDRERCPRWRETAGETPRGDQ